MKGLGTNEKLLIRTLAQKDPLQIETIRSTYQRMYARDLLKDIEKETSGDVEYGLLSLARGPLQSDVHELYNAIAGPGTSEVVLNDVLLGRSNADINAIKGAYQRTYRTRLEDHVKGDLSGKTERHFMIVLGATKAEDAAPVVPQQVDQDTLEIYKATEGKVGTDEVLVSSILSTRNDNQIRAIAHTYQQKYSKTLEQVIKKVRRLLLARPTWGGGTETADAYNPRNSLAILRTRSSSSYAMLRTGTCTRPACSRTPWPGRGRGRSFSRAGWCAFTGTAP